MAEMGKPALDGQPIMTPKLKRRLIALAIVVSTCAAAALILYPVVSVVLGVFTV